MRKLSEVGEVVSVSVRFRRCFVKRDLCRASSQCCAQLCTICNWVGSSSVFSWRRTNVEFSFTQPRCMFFSLSVCCRVEKYCSARKSGPSSQQPALLHIAPHTFMWWEKVKIEILVPCIIADLVWRRGFIDTVRTADIVCGATSASEQVRRFWFCFRVKCSCREIWACVQSPWNGVPREMTSWANNTKFHSKSRCVRVFCVQAILFLSTFSTLSLARKWNNILSFFKPG